MSFPELVLQRISSTFVEAGGIGTAEVRGEQFSGRVHDTVGSESSFIVFLIFIFPGDKRGFHELS